LEILLLKWHQLHLLLVVLGWLLGSTPLRAAEAAPSAFLAFPCDGTAREQRVLHEQAATWIIHQTRAVALAAGRVVYRVPVGSGPLERLQLEVNLVPFGLAFWCYLGLLTGVFECGIFLVVAPLIKRKQESGNGLP
jgi:hypothetical protein